MLLIMDYYSSKWRINRKTATTWQTQISYRYKL